MNKRNRVVSIAWTDEDKQAAASIRQMAGPFKPSVSFLLLLLLRHSAARVMRGEVSLQDLCANHSDGIPETTAVAGAK